MMDRIEFFRFRTPKERLVPTVKKFVAMLFLCAFVFSTAVGCGGDDKDKKKADKPAEKKEKSDK